MNRTAFLLSTAAISLALCASAQTVPQPGNLKPAPQLLKLHQGAGLPDSVAKGPGAVMSDTTALLPAGQYDMVLTFGNQSRKGLVSVTRGRGTSVDVTVTPTETLTGSLDAAGKLQLGGSKGIDRIAIAGTVQSRSAIGSVQLSRDAIHRSGNFSLAPAGSGPRSLRKWEDEHEEDGMTPKRKGPSEPVCGFWCSIGSFLGL